MDRWTKPTHAQRTQWLLTRLASLSSAYNAAFVARVIGDLNVEAMKRAFATLIARHESLRTAFRYVDDELWAVVSAARTLPMEVFDARSWPLEQTHHEVLACHRRPFDLSTGPLVRLCLFELGAQEHVLLLTMHHSITDFQSLEIAVMELDLLYRAETGEPVDIQTLAGTLYPLTDNDELLAGERMRSYWKARLSNPPPAIQWPGHATSYETVTATNRLALGVELTTALRQFAGANNTTIFSVLLAAWAELLAQYTGERDRIIGTPANMREPSSSDAIGCLINPLPLRLHVRPDASFRQLLVEARDAVLGGLAHRTYPFHLMVEAAGPEREVGRNPLFQTMLIMQRTTRFAGWTDLLVAEESEAVRIPWGGLLLAPWSMEQEGQVDITLEVVESYGQIRGIIKSRSSVMPAVAAADMARRFVRRLAEAVANPDCPMDELPLVSHEEATALNLALHTRPVLPAPEEDMVTRILRSARNSPDRTAVIDGDAALSYSDLEARSRAWACRLRAAGVREGVCVGVMLPPSADALVCMLAVLRAGAAYVSIEPQLSSERLAHILASGGARHLIFVGSPSIPAGVQGLPFEDADTVTEDAPRLRPPGPQASACTVFTSGSSAEPKGVNVRHENIIALIDATAAVIDARRDNTWAWVHSASVGLSLWEIWGCLSSGGRLVVVTDEARRETNLFIKLLERWSVTVLVQTPTALQSLVAEVERRGTTWTPNHIVSCGEALPGMLARRVLRWPVALWNMYGTAEAAGFITAQRVDIEAASHASVPVGSPLGHVTVQLLDSRRRAVPVSTVGEVYVGGPAVAAGYKELPELTAERFLDTADGVLFRTGDLMSREGERLHFKGRADNRVKIRGRDVSLDEVEAVLCAVPGLDGGAAVLDESGDDARLTAVVATVGHPSLSAENAVRTHLLERLPHYMIPSRYVSVASMPMTSEGKIDRAALRKLIAQYVPTPSADNGGHVAVEHELMRIWREELGRDHIGLDDSFFDLGGHSHSLMRVWARAERLSGEGTFEPIDLFRYPTIRQLALRIVNGGGGGVAPPQARPNRAETRRQATGLADIARRRLAYRGAGRLSVEGDGRERN